MRNLYKYLMLSFIGYVYSAGAQQINEADSIPVYHTKGSAMAISTVSGEELLKRSNIDPGNTLYGRLNGLTVLQNAGYGGIGETSPTLYIRGISTLNNNSILVLVDGLERPLSSLVTEEIENITVLKDAAALALYGLRGTNGVLLVTTKRGKVGKTDINVAYQHTFTQPTRLPKFANAFAYAQAVNEGLANEGLAPRYSSQELDAYKSQKYPYLFPDVNWIDETLRDWGQRDQINFSAQGGTKKIRYFSLVNFIFDKGLIKEANQNSYSTQLSSSIMNVRTNLDINLTSSTFMQANILARLSEMNRPGSVTDQSLMNTLYTLPASAYPVKSYTGEWGGGSDIYYKNPVAETSSTGYSSAHARGLYADLLLKQDFGQLVEGLSGEFRIGFDAYSDTWDSRTKQYLYESNTVHLDNAGIPTDTITTQYGKVEDELGFSTSLGAQRRNSNLQFRLNYDKKIGSGNLTSFLMYKQDKKVELGQFNSFMHQDILAYGHYALRDRYFFDLSLSASGTSRLPKGKRWGFFPAAAVAWRMGQESFMKQAEWLDELKFRLSFGLTGNDMITYNLDQYPYVGGGSFIFNDAYRNFSGMREGHLPSRNVTYEKTQKFNFGIESSFLNKIDFSADFFYDKTYDIMVNSAGVTSSMLGATNAYEPNGKVKNYGVELGLNINDRMGDFKYNLGGQFSFIRNEIVAMNEQYQPYDYLKATGNSVSQLFGLEAIGFFKDETDIAQSPTQTFSKVYPGDIKYKDQNNDGRIDEYDITPIGSNSLCPEIYYSVTVDLEYKGFGINALLQGAGNYSVMLNTPGLYFPLMNNWTISEHYLESYWKPGAANTDIKYPRLTTTESNNNYRANSVFIADASYLKLRSAEIYYKLPKSLKSKLRMEECKFFVRGMDLFSIDNIKVTDPEATGTAYPTLRTFHIGFTATF